jgi:hypothetical protein
VNFASIHFCIFALFFTIVVFFTHNYVKTVDFYSFDTISQVLSLFCLSLSKCSQTRKNC